MHISLDSALGRQRRLNSVGESVLQIAPNAAAAYSLRSLTGGDPKVVRVRRSSDNAESDFTASEVSSGALVNFVNEIQTLGTVTNSSGNNGFTLTNTSSTGFTATTDTATGVCGWPYTAKAGDKITVSFDAVIRSGTPQFLPRRATALSSDNLASVVSDSPLSVNSTASYSFEFTYDDDQAGSLTFSEGDDNADFDISNFQVTVFKGAGFVETWYDQSGNSKDATQATANLQPKIVNAGSLLTDGITFDGTDQVGLVTGSFSLTQAFTTFSVSHTDDASTSVGIWATAASATNNFNVTALFRSDDGFAVNAGSTLTTAGTIDYVADRTYLQTNVVNGGSSSIFVDGATGKTGNAGSTNPSGVLIIGYFKSGAYFNLDGAIKELIIYDSDQTSNRAALETNIADANGVTLS